MACFLVPTAEAIVTTIIKKQVEKKEALEAAEIEKAGGKVSWKTKLSWLTNLLWGGAALLCLEHIWHGEVVFYPPFLTAMADPADTVEMLHEMATVGVGMAVLVTLVWLGMIIIVDKVPALRARFASKEA